METWSKTKLKMRTIFLLSRDVDLLRPQDIAEWFWHVFSGEKLTAKDVSPGTRDVAKLLLVKLAMLAKSASDWRTTFASVRKVPKVKKPAEMSRDGILSKSMINQMVSNM